MISKGIAMRDNSTTQRRPVARAEITKKRVDALEAGALLSDSKIMGFVCRKLPSGHVVYGYRFRAGGRQRWLTIGKPGITPDQARRIAKKLAGDVADGRDPAAEQEAERAADSSTVNALLDAFLERHVRKSGLRKGDEVERVFRVYVRPRIGELSIYEIGRRAVTDMLDEIADANGPVMADRTLAHVRKAFNWYATRDERFNSPIVKGMARTKPAERARKRKLDDQELRDLWNALDTADAPACYSSYVRVLLLTAQRRSEVAEMLWAEIEGGVWVIPGSKHKTGKDEGDKAVPLTDAVLQLLGKPRKSGFVFSSTDGELPFSGFSKAKRALDKAIAKLRKSEKRKPMSHWTLHDLRRTARSLMSRGGVAADIAERVLGHKIPGVRGVYDRHEYVAEKRDALERLAALVERIINPPAGNVIPLARSAERA
jgi:integrase